MIPSTHASPLPSAGDQSLSATVELLLSEIKAGLPPQQAAHRARTLLAGLTAPQLETLTLFLRQHSGRSEVRTLMELLPQLEDPTNATGSHLRQRQPATGALGGILGLRRPAPCDDDEQPLLGDRHGITGSDAAEEELANILARGTQAQISRIHPSALRSTGQLLDFLSKAESGAIAQALACENVKKLFRSENPACQAKMLLTACHLSGCPVEVFTDNGLVDTTADCAALLTELIQGGGAVQVHELLKLGVRNKPRFLHRLPLAENPLIAAALTGHPQLVDALSKAGYSLPSRLLEVNAYGPEEERSLLERLIDEGQHTVIAKLCELDLLRMNEELWRAILVRAIRSPGKTEDVEGLISTLWEMRPTDLGTSSMHTHDPVATAVEYGRGGLLEKLLVCTAAPQARNPDAEAQQTALRQDGAAQRVLNELHYFDGLQKTGYLLQTAIRNGDSDTVRTLLELGAALQAKGFDAVVEANTLAGPSKAKMMEVLAAHYATTP